MVPRWSRDGPEKIGRLLHSLQDAALRLLQDASKRADNTPPPLHFVSLVPLLRATVRLVFVYEGITPVCAVNKFYKYSATSLEDDSAFLVSFGWGGFIGRLLHSLQDVRCAHCRTAEPGGRSRSVLEN